MAELIGMEAMIMSGSCSLGSSSPCCPGLSPREQRGHAVVGDARSVGRGHVLGVVRDGRAVAQNFGDHRLGDGLPS